MHPALSVIFFTTLSGAGYGILFWCSILLLTGLLPASGFAVLLVVAVGAIFVTVGLLSSTLHLGHPERAWRALSQWRSSWLSREGVAAILGFVPLLVLGLTLIGRLPTEPWLKAGSFSVALMAIITVFCTAMIYASLRPIRQWHQPWVPAIYFVFAAMSGALWLLAILSAWGLQPDELAVYFAVALTSLGWAMKWWYWLGIDRSRGKSTTASATGLSGRVKPLDPPHTEENYLLKEMGYQVARAHGRKLRRWSVIFGWLVPVVLLLMALVWPRLLLPMSLAAAVSNLLGIFIERWLFFAQATHSVTLYYGASRA